MSTFIQVKKRCAMCGKSHTFREIRSYTIMGSRDLDTRPPMFKRAALGVEIQMCDHCFYSNSDISKRVPGMKMYTLSSDEYQSVIKNREIVNTTGQAYWLSSIIHAQRGDYKTAGYLALSSAWSFDDRYDREYSTLMRKRAIECFEREIAPEYQLNINMACILVDMKRRIGDFDGAITVAEYLINQASENKENLGEIIEKVLSFQIELCKDGNTRCYRISDAMGEE